MLEHSDITPLDFQTAHNWENVLPLIDPAHVDQFIEDNCDLSEKVEQFKEDHDLTMCQLSEILLAVADPDFKDWSESGKLFRDFFSEEYDQYMEAFVYRQGHILVTIGSEFPSSFHLHLGRMEFNSDNVFELELILYGLHVRKSI